MSDNMLFLSNSINDPEEDLIGFDTYVTKLDNAIDAGAQMIAITSPFGSGKSSIIELLKRKRKNNKREKFLNVQMWSELSDLKSEKKVPELHRNFLYQIGSSISAKKGTYINRRLSNNYGLLKLHVNRPKYWMAIIFSAIAIILGWVIKKNKDFVLEYIPKLNEIIDYLPVVLFGFAIVLLFFVVTGAEIIFSSKNSEKQREIEADEIIDLYRNEIINERGKVLSFICNVLRKICFVRRIPILMGMKYIVIIEDLDRTDDDEAVIHFLKELRKYYIPVNQDNSSYHNKVIFVINIKPESSVVKNDDKEKSIVDESALESSNKNEIIEENYSEKTMDENRIDLLYSKLFDYVLNLQTINIIDYDVVLCALLQENISYIEKHSLKTNTEKLSDIQGMQWMTHGKNVNIREIKNRLNLTTVIFETLKERFPGMEERIDFRKCAVAAYVLTEYEKEFSLTNDNTFDKLIEVQIRKKLDEKITVEMLKTNNIEYAKTIYELICSRLIGGDYRMYFYNYPKKSKIYSNDELNIQNAILYGIMCKNFNFVAEKVVESKSDIVQESLKKLRQLELPLPQTVIKTEALFLSAIQFEYEAVLKMFERMNVNEASLDKNISNILSILKYDPERKIYNAEIFRGFCNVWEKIFSETHILKLREVLCYELKNEVLMFENLFAGEHSVITPREMEMLSFDNSLTLLNIESKNFSVAHVKYVVDRFNALINKTEEIYQKVIKILEGACNLFSVVEVADFLLDFMIEINKIVPEFENAIYELLINSDAEYENDGIDEERKNNLFLKYRKLIDSLEAKDLSCDILDHIDNMENLQGLFDYSPKVAQALYDNQYYLMSVLIRIEKNIDIDFSDQQVVLNIKKNVEWLKKREVLVLKIRKQILIKASNLNEYLFLFSDDFPLVSNKEFVLLTQNPTISIANVLDYIPNKCITEEAVEYISRYFNKAFVNNNTAFDVIKSLDKYSEKIIVAFFEKIDFSHAFLFYTFAYSKKKLIKKLFFYQLKLDTYDGKLKFMELTKYLDEEFELALLNNMNSVMEERYVSLVRKKLGTSPIKSSTIKILNSFSNIYVFAPNSGVNEKMLEEKEYIYYIVSTTLYAKKFVMMEDKKELLWPVYVEIYTNPSKYSQTRAYMKYNRDFLDRIIETGIFVDFADSVLETLSLTKQSENLISCIFERSNNFAIKYFSSLELGFTDHGAAKMFVEKLAMDQNKTILINNSVRDNIYDMLVDPALKSKYTKLRKNAGCKY